MDLPLLRITLSWLIFVLFQRIAVAGPVALPEAAPPRPTAAPEAVPKLVDAAISIKELEARQYYYTFSGAIYIVGANGEEITAAEPAECPAEAPQGCGNINAYNWCCTSGSVCSMLSNGVVGCCPSGGQCEGTVNVAQITTATLTQFLTTTQYPQEPTTVVAISSETTTTLYPLGLTTIVEIGGTNTTTVLSGIYLTESTGKPSIMSNGYCSTLIAHGPNLPATAQGACGTILVISRAYVRPIGWKLPALVAAFYGTLGLYSYFGFRWWC